MVQYYYLQAPYGGSTISICRRRILVSYFYLQALYGGSNISICRLCMVVQIFLSAGFDSGSNISTFRLPRVVQQFPYRPRMMVHSRFLQQKYSFDFELVTVQLG